MTTELDNYQDVIDSRDVIARIESLREEREEYQERDRTEPLTKSWSQANPEEAQELAALEKLAEEASGYAAGWQCGEMLIRDSYFTEYARELLEDCGDLPKDLPHYIHIDWESTARDIRMDYTAVDFAGVTYWIR
jgi:hypothetical protein